MTQIQLSSTTFLTDTTQPVLLPVQRIGNVVAALAVVPVLVFEADTWVQVKASRGISISDRITRLERDPKRARALQAARQRLAQLTDQANPGHRSLASLRLAAGLSQAQLAEKIGTQQSNVSRWERDPSDLRATSIAKLADALSVEPSVILTAILPTGEVTVET